MTVWNVFLRLRASMAVLFALKAKYAINKQGSVNPLRIVHPMQIAARTRFVTLLRDNANQRAQARPVVLPTGVSHVPVLLVVAPAVQPAQKV